MKKTEVSDEVEACGKTCFVGAHVHEDEKESLNSSGNSRKTCFLDATLVHEYANKASVHVEICDETCFLGARVQILTNYQVNLANIFANVDFLPPFSRMYVTQSNQF